MPDVYDYFDKIFDVKQNLIKKAVCNNNCALWSFCFRNSVFGY